LSLPGDLSQFDSLVEIISYLRSPQGCPWDRKQTHASLREHLLEESYETLEALDEADTAKLCTELGDLLLQIVLHAQIAREAGEFDMGDVVESINQKLLYRHPHVFGSVKVRNAEEVLANWEELKKEERQGNGSMLDGVPKAMPSLAYSQSVQDRVARIGFDWPDDEGVVDKLAEEVAEFKCAASQKRKSEEFGDVLFTLAGIDLESALREANQRFYKRFSYMEELCRKRGLDLAKMTLAEQNALWEETKRGME
jgi:tetrapyrrole methylase family protein/MazG family protein